MNNRLILAGVLIACLGLSFIVPVPFDWLERGYLSGLCKTMLAFGTVIIVAGVAAVGAGWRQSQGPPIPAPVRATIIANMTFLAFCVLELGDGLVRQDGRIFYWTTVLFPPASLLLYGLLAAHRWAWWFARAVALLGVLWFVVFTVLLPFAALQSNGVPVPWTGRIYMAGVSLAFAGIAAYVFRALGKAEARSYFGRHSAA